MLEQIGKIRGLVDQFGKEEVGNRLSNFSLIALQGMITNELNLIQQKYDLMIKKEKENETLLSELRARVETVTSPGGEVLGADHPAS